MSIIFTKPIEETKLRLAYNNDVIRFYSDNTLAAKFCTIMGSNASANVNVTLYPAPDGSFFFNFKPYVSALINTRNFEDTLQPVLDRTNPDTFIYNATAGTLLQMDVSITITFSNDSTQNVTHTLTWLAGAAQPGNYTPLSNNSMYILSPLAKAAGNGWHIKYWQGYPFDVSVYSPNAVFRVNNTTNLLSQQFTVPGLVFRMVLSDGDDDETLEDVLPLADGHNSLHILGAAEPSQNDVFITLDKVPYKSGIYLKWLNALGGYSYWLFEDTCSIDRSTKQLGELDRDNDNPEDSFGRTIQIGKESSDTLKIVAELLTENERRIVEGILDSPKIYLFTGQPYARNSYRDWVEVSLKTTSARIKNPRQPLTNFTFDVELPVRFTQTL
ncbi:hypothetical protein Q765_15020 [Flavobacterium rivuli WB 3.3-2 = DSM 21788]|uniref:Uncharacterized protein n=1 Tax=Flavobacterium rivuli WB 3.3-2 = DSM 21788 TaxID=1121895 RepID=A0A0A2M2R6_9FLAO|nr:hypothetical protein [Flavobacterium rivuli]KGO85728.1 hypothetical protein Q765_15020 [Flavobacterium rivuli WB 3.3-2 = DSM 21788]